MDSMKKIRQTLKIISIIVVFLMFTSCLNNGGDSTFESLIKSTSTELNKTNEIKLKQNIKFDYSKLYVFEGPRVPSEIKRITKIEYNELLADGDRLYLFVKNETIIKQEISSCKDVNVHRLMNVQGYAILYPETRVFGKKQKNGDDLYYDTFYKNN